MTIQEMIEELLVLGQHHGLKTKVYQTTSYGDAEIEQIAAKLKDDTIRIIVANSD